MALITNYGTPTNSGDGGLGLSNNNPFSRIGVEAPWSGANPIGNPGGWLLSKAGKWLKGDPVSHQASDELAALYRGDWDDYLARFAPEEQRQVDAMSDVSNENERKQAIADVGTSYARAPQQLEQSAFTSGVTLTPQDKASYARRLNTEQGLATVNAANRVTQAQTDRSYGVFGTPAYAPGGVGLNSMRKMIG